MAIARVAIGLARDLLGLVFPVRCGSCGRAIPPTDGPLCPDCAASVLALIDLGYCRRCGQDAGPYSLRRTEGQPGGVCGGCEQTPLRYAALARVGPYAEPLDRLIKRFKYAAGQHLAGPLGDWQAARLAAQPWLADVQALVPVPLHWRRRLARGFNQSELLAERVAARAARPVEPLLVRPVHRVPQAALPRSQRFENVRGVFAAPRPDRVAGRTLCLIDDVCTTGATLSEAARTLLAADARAVYAAVVAVAQPPPAYSHMLVAE